MRIYGIPLTGSTFVRADSPAAAFEVAENWSAAVLEGAVTGGTIPVPADIEIVILKPRDEGIVDATEEVVRMMEEAKQG